MARSSNRGLPRGLDGFELGVCRGSYLKRRLSARPAIRLHAAGFLMSAAAAASSPSGSFIQLVEAPLRHNLVVPKQDAVERLGRGGKIIIALG